MPDSDRGPSGSADETVTREAFGGYAGRLNFGWPAPGGLWTCGCGWKDTPAEAVEWQPDCWECPACGRRDLVQYVEASIAVPSALLVAERERADRLEALLRRCESPDGWCGEMPWELREDIEAALRGEVGQEEAPE